MITVTTAKISMKIMYDNDAHKYLALHTYKIELIPVLSLPFLLFPQKIYMSRDTPTREKHMMRM